MSYIPPAEFGPFIKHFLATKDVTESYVQKKTGIRTKTLNRWEKGDVQRIHDDTLEEFAKCFSLTVDDFLKEFKAYRETIRSATAQTTTRPPDNDEAAASIPSDTTKAISSSHVEPNLVNDTGIPRLFDHFRGRDDLLKKLKDQLCGGKITRSIALYGKPGVGKTAIAMAIANDPTVQQYFHGRILWAGLGTNPDIEGIQHRWSNLLHIQGIEAEIDSQPLLLILDDVWDIDHVAKFFQLGSYNPSWRYLITTAPQSLADMISDSHSFEVHEFDTKKGLELLQYLAPKIVQAEKEEVEALVREVGGLPLALWLMGTYLKREANRKQPGRIQDALKLLHNYEQRLHLKGFPLLSPTHDVLLPDLVT